MIKNSRKPTRFNSYTRDRRIHLRSFPKMAGRPNEGPQGVDGRPFLSNLPSG
ncbi:MAG: hypothetical protein KGZ85_02450 [Ignavibacterium sp.]|nr:hypothetical protein [Ignavibacterium sp.]